MADKPITAKITDVIQYKSKKLYSEQVFVEFAQGRRLRNEPFDSPLLNADNISKWRQIMVTAIQGKNCPDKAPRCEQFEEYKKAIKGKSVYIGLSGDTVIAIGIDPNKMFSPDAYGLFDLPGAIDTSKNPDGKIEE